ncbi:MAG: hypothetical protein ABI885_04610 [Gammaproteobacteria bacterium]
MAFQSVRRHDCIDVWGRSAAKAAAMVESLQAASPESRCGPPDLPAAASDADIISCATSASQPILFSKWISNGTHVDLVGAFSARTREADGSLIQRSRLYADISENVLREAGGVLIPLCEGVIDERAVLGDLGGLATGVIAWRTHAPM